MDALEFLKNLEHAPRDLELLLCGLIRICGGAEGNREAAVARLSKLRPKDIRRTKLRKNLLLEITTVVQFHIFVCVPGIAILAPKFAPTVGIEGPCKRHPAAGFTVKGRARGKSEVLNSCPLAQLRAFLGHPCNADEFRTPPHGNTR